MMKNILLTLIVLAISMVHVSAQDIKMTKKMPKMEAPKMEMKQDHKHDAHLKSMVGIYLALNEALFTDNFMDAKKHVALLAKEVTMNADMKDHKGDMEKHAKHHAEMVAAVTKAGAATDIKGIRAEFKAISEHLITAVKNQGYGETLFVQFCPMADGNKGANWISDKKDIKNPYFGKMMLTCGSTKETLEKIK